MNWIVTYWNCSRKVEMFKHPKDGAIVPMENIQRKDPNGSDVEEIKELNEQPKYKT